MLLHEDVDWKTNKAWRANKDCIVRRENGTVLLVSLHKIIGPNRTNRSHQYKPTKHSQAEFAVASDPPLLQLVLSSLMPKNIKTCENPSFVSIDEMWDERIHIAITTWCHEECTGNNQNNSIMIMCNASTCFFFCLLLMKSSCLHVLPPPSGCCDAPPAASYSQLVSGKKSLLLFRASSMSRDNSKQNPNQDHFWLHSKISCSLLESVKS